MKVLVAMSGGVDSSVTAYLLKKEGNECCGCTMKLYNSEALNSNNTDGCSTCSATKTCCSADDVADARSVANKLGMDFYVLNYKEDFDKYVIQNFVDCYLIGHTPNPCIECNRHLKFGKLIQQAEALGYDSVATGHYARIEHINGRYVLKKALDLTKDQSYVLYNLTQDQLAKTKFPLGSLTKAEARLIAEEQGFINARKHDSQDICFIPNGNYSEFITNYSGKTYPQGDFIDTNGNKLGTHKGIINYTIGQRKGLGLALNEPMYVKEINVDNNTVVLARDEELFSSELIAEDVNLISIAEIKEPIRVKAKIRYRHTESDATVSYLGDGRYKVVFDEPQRAITKGQAVVFYDGDIVVGGGTIVG